LLQLSPQNSELQLKESTCRENYVRINHSAISLMKQQCKAEWIGYVDECTRLFMARIKQKKANASIYFIKDHNNQRVEGFEAVTNVLTNYYKELLGNNTSHRASINPTIVENGPTLSLAQQLSLCKPFKDAEIKHVIFFIPNHKSPGLDAYNSGFFKAC